MKNILIIILTLTLLTSCNKLQNQTVDENERLELVPEPDKAERLKYEAIEKLKKSNCFLSEPDTSLCGITLRNSESATKIIGSENGFYNIINVVLPLPEDKAAMLLFHLDMKGIAVSRGSACQSGSSSASHVLSEILSSDDLAKPSLRISFSHYNTKEDVDYLIEVLAAV